MIKIVVYRYQPDERKWWMTLVNDPTVWAVSNASMKSLIMGAIKLGSYQIYVEIYVHLVNNGDEEYCQDDICGRYTMTLTVLGKRQFFLYP